MFTETRTYKEVDRDSCELVTTVTEVVMWSVSFKGTRITCIGNEDVDEGVGDGVGVVEPVEVSVEVSVEVELIIGENVVSFEITGDAEPTEVSEATEVREATEDAEPTEDTENTEVREATEDGENAEEAEPR